MEPIEVGKLDELLKRAENLMNRVEDTYLITKDILLGTQIGDWIADLKASGTSSATYSDATRMNALIANEDAANNSDVAKYLVQWAVANNKYGTYCGAACGTVSGVTWNSLTTPNAVMGNATAFTALCGNSVAFKTTMQNNNCKTAIWNNATITEPVLRSSNSARAVLNGMRVRAGVYEKSDIKWFVLGVEYDRQYANVSFDYVTGNYGNVAIDSLDEIPVNRFVTDLISKELNNQSSTAYAHFYYVDFS